MEKYRVEAGPFVGQVDVTDGVIVAAPNVWGKFRGQGFARLTGWLNKTFGDCKVDKVDKVDKMERMSGEPDAPNAER